MGALGNVVEFLIGWTVLPRIVFFIFAFIFAYLGFNEAQVLIYIRVVEAIIIAVLFFFRKALAFGYLLDYVLSLLGAYAVLTGKI